MKVISHFIYIYIYLISKTDFIKYKKRQPPAHGMCAGGVKQI